MDEADSGQRQVRRNSGADERSLAELTKQLSDQATTLARKEVELAKAEMSLKAKRLGLGAAHSVERRCSPSLRSVP